MDMDSDTYLKDRVDDQMGWYSRKSGINKKYHIWSSSAILFCSALIPFLSGADFAEFEILGWTLKSSWAVGLLGVITASLTGFTALMKFQEKWTMYRSTAEALQREKILYNTSTQPYQAGAASFHLFVRNIEEILGNENRSWAETMSQNEQE